MRLSCLFASLKGLILTFEVMHKNYSIDYGNITVHITELHQFIVVFLKIRIMTLHNQANGTEIKNVFFSLTSSV